MPQRVAVGSRRTRTELESTLVASSSSVTRYWGRGSWAQRWRSLYDEGPMPNPFDATPVEPALPAVAKSRRWTLFGPDADLGARAVLGDRFEVGDLLGAGGNSWVHACRDRLLQNTAAITRRSASETAERLHPS